jgi:nucleoside-diphosphate-sugar epimerase
MASPMPGRGDDFRADYLKPAVEGTVSILAAAKASATVKRVVVTSSVLACMPLGSMNASYLKIKGELMPSSESVHQVVFHFTNKCPLHPEDQSQGLKVDRNMQWPEGFAGHGLKYHASKILAHQATIDWTKKNKPHFSLATLHPSFVLGDSLIQNSAREVSGINALF